MVTDKKEEAFVLTPEELEIFKQKTLFSVHILPACYGGHRANDELCQNCAVAIGGDNLLVNVFNMAEKVVNEEGSLLAIRSYGGPFFAVHSSSCVEEHQKLEAAGRALETANRFRKERRAIQNITRLPKGEVREGKTPFDYVKYYPDGLWVRLGKNNDKYPNDKYPLAIGVLYRFDGLETFREKLIFRSDRIVGYISGILKPTEADPFVRFEPKKDEEYFLIFPKRQIEGQESLALEVTRKRKDTQEDEILLVALEPDSYEKVSARFDDIGRL